MQKLNRRPLPLPLGEVAERSEDGEGKTGCNTLSVTCGDSSPKGRAKELYSYVGTKMERTCTDWRTAQASLASPCGRGGRAKARTERGKQAAIPSQSPAVTAPPKGEPRGAVSGNEKWSVSVTDTLHSLYAHPEVVFLLCLTSSGTRQWRPRPSCPRPWPG